MLSVDNYSVSYGQSEVIHNLNFEVKPNEIVAVMGRNGMGKTTLMKSLIGVLPSKGNIRLDNKNMQNLKSHQRVAGGMSFVPQGRMIFSTMTVKENIETGSTAMKSLSCFFGYNGRFSVSELLAPLRLRSGATTSMRPSPRIASASAHNPSA